MTLPRLRAWQIRSSAPAVNRIEWGWGPARSGEGPVIVFPCCPSHSSIWALRQWWFHESAAMLAENFFFTGEPRFHIVRLSLGVFGKGYACQILVNRLSLLAPPVTQSGVSNAGCGARQILAFLLMAYLGRR